MKRTILAALLALVWGSAHAAESTISVTVGSGTNVLGASATSGAHSGAFSSRVNIGNSTNPAVAAVVDANGLHVAISDGADVALGAQADAAYSGTGSGSLISISKGIFGALSGNLGVTITSPVDGSGNLLVSPVGITVADEAAFTAGTSTFSTVGGFFQTTATSNPLTNGQSGQAQMTAQRAFFINLRNASGTEIGTSTTPIVNNVTQVASTAITAGNGAVGAGTQRVTLGSGGVSGCGSTIAISQTTSTDLHTMTNTGHICTIMLVSATAQSISLSEGTGTVCASGTTFLIGSTGGTVALAANGGFSATASQPIIDMVASADHLCLLQSSSGNVSGFITYTDHS